jgi:ankyrin repeat protein
MVKACSSNNLDECTGLNLILTYKPELECKNLAGDTALSLAVKLQCVSSVDLLVSVKVSIMI